MSEVKVKAYPHGTFSWVDLSTTDAEAARAFYCELFGWEAVDNPIPGGGVYTMLLQDGKNVCALSQMGQEQMDMGMPSFWLSYISVDDVDAVAARVAELGGTLVMPPFDVMDAGRMAMLQDPTGAMVSLWQTINHRGADLFNLPNSLGWNELTTRDGAAGQSFYTQLLGWNAVQDENGYTMWMNGERVNGGMMVMDDKFPPDIPSHWAVYISVTDINATTEKAKALGGVIHMGPVPAGEVGTFSIIQDPTGATFTAIQLVQSDANLPGE